MQPARKLLRWSPWKTTTFRLALSYLGIFSISALSLLSLVSWSTAVFIDWQVQETVEAEATGLIEQFRSHGINGLASAIIQRLDNNLTHRSTYLLVNSRGNILVGNLSNWPELNDTKNNQGWLRLSAEDRHGQQYLDRFMARVYELPNGYRLLVGRSLADANRMKSNINKALIWGLALTLMLGLIGGYLTSRHLLGRVESMNETSRRILGGQLHSRMKVYQTNDEFDRLARSFNAMMDQIEQLVEGMRTVTDNVAHDLRTPLTRLRTRIELALSSSNLSEEARIALEACVADSDHLLLTFSALLTIGQAEAGQHLHNFITVELSRLVEDASELYEPLAEEKNISLISHIFPSVTLEGNPHLLFQALANMIDNAIKYTPDGGTIQVTLEQTETSILLKVTDNGCGIPESQREKVLDRFVRLDSTRSTQGNGLGLSLVKAVGRLHNAQLLLNDAIPHGLEITLAFNR